MNKEKIKINTKFIVQTLRNCGYNNYTAIADIVDNCIDANPTFVNVYPVYEKGEITELRIVDDGIGMDEETLNEAMSLGSETDKTPEMSLGMYGTGLKTASFSIGKVLDVFTMESDGKLLHANISLDNISDGINVVFNDVKEESEAYKDFMDEIHSKNGGSSSGTVVKISNLDQLTNKTNITILKDTIYNKISELFNWYIKNSDIKFYVDEKIVKYTDFAYQGILIDSGVIDTNNGNITWNVFKMPNTSCEDRELIDNKFFRVKTNSRTSGFYFYRNKRLVGQSVKLLNSLNGGDNYTNQFRCEMFFDGNCDKSFGTSFTKMIGEKAKETIDQSLMDKMKKCFEPLISQIRKEKKNLQSHDESEEEIKKKNDMYNSISNSLNTNILLSSISKRGRNKHSDKEVYTPKTKNGPQKNPNPRKNRNDKWFGGYSEENIGENEQIYSIEKKENLTFVIINKDHKYYDIIYSKLPEDIKINIAKVFAAEGVAKEKSEYYINDDFKSIIDEYLSYLSDSIKKVLS